MIKGIKFLCISKLKFISSVINKLSFPICIQKLFNNLRHKIIKKQLFYYFDKSYSKMKSQVYLNKKYKNNVIWVFWWQGNDMPIIVKRCIDSIKSNSFNNKVILITKNNIKKYSTIPDYIYNKLYNNEITLTQFSDILRFNLLRNHGGLWIDSTMLCTSKLSDKYFQNIYTSGGYNNQNNYFVSAKWTAFLIGGYKGNEIFIFMDEFFKIYWKYNDYLIDYFLVDYALDFVYRHNIGDFKFYVDEYAFKNNPHLHDLMNILNTTYDDKIYDDITRDTNLFKLSYKKKIIESDETFYNKIINKKIPKI